ncbi:GNAT family N-acetyltransferase [Fontimonas sp. SYSU GA230001]|uniref:GNAT family N-acetyltransferase n=1 Tax=Fontimonas sp. SYSU GA230001 TaxID=3142450 RepID=UPI0032B5DE72
MTDSPFRIETQRLLIREWRAEDRPGLERLTGDAQMMRYITGGEVWNAERNDGLVARQQAHLAATGLCMGPVLLRATGEMIGVAGAQPLDRLPGFDLGWWIWRAYWNQGLATEAAWAVYRHAFDRGGLDRLYAVIDPDNGASRRVAEKLGMRLHGHSTADRTASWRPAVDVLLYLAERSGSRVLP